MNWFNNFKISAKILIGFITVALLAGIIGLMGIKDMRVMEATDIKLYEEATIPLGLVGEILGDFQKNRVNLRDSIIETDLTLGKKYVDKEKELMASLNSNLQSYSKIALKIESQKNEVQKLTITLEKFGPLQEKIIALAADNRKAEATALMRSDEAAKILGDVSTSIETIYKLNLEEGKNISSSNTNIANKTVQNMGIVIAIAMALAIFLGMIISKVIANPIRKLTNAANKLALGDINVVVESSSKDEIGELATAFRAMIENIKDQVEAAEAIAAGNLAVKIRIKSDEDVLSKKMEEMLSTINALIKETEILIKTTQEGKLNTRGKSELFTGGWKELVTGMNTLIDAFVGPINVTANYVDRISKGDIPEKITDIYYGDFNKIKNNLNQCIDAVNLLVVDANMLAKAGVEGRLDTRADVSKHAGDFAKIVEGVNYTLDAVIQPIQEASKVLEEMSKGNLKVSVNGNYEGDHAKLKNVLNNTIDTLLGYVNEISQVLNEMAQGNLTLGIATSYKGDFVAMKDSINLILSSFNDTLGEINTAAEQVSSGSKQVSDSSQALSQGSTEQASAIEEITASMEEIASQTKQNAVNANEANQLSTIARDNATQGNKQMAEMLSAMTEINSASSSISKIIKVIDEIAFQTNILALNAAVEAARAGQHGKGFAVVAEEVRNLAARSANAAKETTAMIEGSIEKTQKGTKIANHTAEALEKIVENVAKVADLVGTIAVASNEQASGIAQINQAIDQVSMVTQTNTATAEESAAASEELSAQSLLLKNMVSKFKLKKYSSSNSLEQINPEMLKLMEDMIRNRTKIDVGATERQYASTPRAKISLDDGEFGKY